MRAFFFIALFILSACSPQTRSIPTSAKLEQIRAVKSEKISYTLDTQKIALGDPVFIRVFKKEGLLETWMKPEGSNVFVLFKRYPICKYSGQLGPKLREGDLQSPEGFYSVGAEQLNPNSRFHLSFDLGYPNEYDRRHGRTGSLLMIHGDCRSEGCYAMTDKAIEEIYLLVEASIAGGADVPVHIFPFRMSEANLRRHHDLGWGPFWRNLKEGHDAFEMTNIPPEIGNGTGQTRYKYVLKDQHYTSYAQRVRR